MRTAQAAKTPLSDPAMTKRVKGRGARRMTISGYWETRHILRCGRGHRVSTWKSGDLPHITGGYATIMAAVTENRVTGAQRIRARHDVAG